MTNDISRKYWEIDILTLGSPGNEDTLRYTTKENFLRALERVEQDSSIATYRWKQVEFSNWLYNTKA